MTAAFVTVLGLLSTTIALAHRRSFSITFEGTEKGHGLVFGTSVLEDAENILGAGKETTGFHPNSARTWSLGNGTYFEVDGEHSRAGHYVIDYALLYKGRIHPRGAPVTHVVPVFHNVHLGERLTDLEQQLRGRYTREQHYDRPCVVWHSIDRGAHQTSTTFVADTAGVVDFIESDVRP